MILSNVVRNEPSIPSDPTASERTMAAIFRSYPFLSGRGMLANSSIARWMVPRRSRVVWGQVRAARCAVPLNDLVGRSIFLMGDLDPKVTWVVDRCLRPGNVVLDVGANLGLVSLLAAQRVGSQGRVIAFEPSPPVLVHLQRTIDANTHLPIELNRCALGDSTGTLNLHVPPDNAGAASVMSARPEAQVYEVQVRRLADVLADNRVQHVDLLKIDVEGFEASVLRGLFASPEAPYPKIILFEDHAPSSSPAIKLLVERGYRVAGLPKAMIRLRPIPSGNSAFVACRDFIALHRDTDPQIVRNLHA